MRKFVIIGIVVVIAGAAAAYVGLLSREQPAAAQGQAGPGGAGAGARGGMGGGGFGGGGMGGGRGGFGGGVRPPMTVEVGAVTRGDIGASLTVVGNLIGEQSVEVVPKTGGRLVSVSVQLGDRVRRNQPLAKIEDREIVEQVRQAEASHTVAQATIRQREADLMLAETNVERSRNLYQRQLLPKQTLDDSEARYQAALAQLDLAKAQLAQTDARLQELRINLANTTVASPVDGFVAKRYVDPGAWVSQNAPIVAVVDISRLRLVANVVEKDLRVVNAGDVATVEVDAYPGETFRGRIARVAPVLDPATRTAQMEVEVPNADARLKPGMYARIRIQVETRQNALLIPVASLVDVEGRRGVFVANADDKAEFVPVEVGLQDGDRAEVRSGLQEGDRIVTVGATALRVNDTLVIAGQPPRGGPGGAPGGPRGRRGMGAGGPGGERQGTGAEAAPGGRGGRGMKGRPEGGQRPQGQGQ
ncbi:MAG: efflux RND transporter periplasmic adaptor subunit [Acidobacteriota bacterium]